MQRLKIAPTSLYKASDVRVMPPGSRASRHHPPASILFPLPSFSTGWPVFFSFCS